MRQTVLPAFVKIADNVAGISKDAQEVRKWRPTDYLPQSKKLGEGNRLGRERKKRKLKDPDPT